MDVTIANELIRRRAGTEVSARLFAAVADDEVLVVSGSLVEGLGNRRSDLDFFVLSDGHPRDVPVRMAMAGDSWVDIEYVRMAALGELADKLAATDPANLARVLQLTHKDLDRYYRLAIGVPVKGSGDATRMLSLHTFRGLLKPWATVHAGAYAARAAVALGNGELTAAVLFASHAAHFCVEGELTEVGELYPSLKYSYEKAVRAHGAGSVQARSVAALLHPSGDLGRYVAAVTEHVGVALAECLSRSHSDDLPVTPATPLAYGTHLGMPIVMTRKAAYELLPEDAAAVADLLSLPGLAGAGGGNGPGEGAGQAAAHRLVLRQALVDLGLLVPERKEALSVR